MLNRSASLAMSTSDLIALPGKLDIKRHSPSILYICSLQSCDHLLGKSCRFGSAKIGSLCDVLLSLSSNMASQVRCGTCIDS